ncbi:hypothetical protein JHW43_004392 [Diplocarpon mali]|nr:hypothetical protein JHW43_004392 [Diplocarpon mali]
MARRCVRRFCRADGIARFEGEARGGATGAVSRGSWCNMTSRLSPSALLPVCSPTLLSPYALPAALLPLCSPPRCTILRCRRTFSKSIREYHPRCSGRGRRRATAPQPSTARTAFDTRQMILSAVPYILPVDKLTTDTLRVYTTYALPIPSSPRPTTHDPIASSLQEASAKKDRMPAASSAWALRQRGGRGGALQDRVLMIASSSSQHHDLCHSPGKGDKETMHPRPVLVQWRGLGPRVQVLEGRVGPGRWLHLPQRETGGLEIPV